MNKRGFEALHIFFWLVKDFAWLRGADYRIIATIGFFATGWGFLIFIWDVRDLFKDRNSDGNVQYEIKKEMCSSLGCFFWLAGNSWWAIGENWDLQHTSGFNDVYDQYCQQAVMILAAGLMILLPFWILNFMVESFGLSRRAYVQRLCRTSQHLYMTGRDIPFATTISCHPSISNLRGLQTIATLEQDSSSEDLRLCSRYKNKELDYVMEMDICGMPYKWPGIVGVPATMPHLTRGIRDDKTTFMFQCEGLFSYRDYENIIILFWTLKDLTWLIESAMWAQVSWYLWASLIFYVAVDMLSTLLRYRTKCHVLMIDVVHASAIVIWVISNIIWCWGEMFVDDYVHGLSADPSVAIKELIPPLFSRWDELPPGSWLYRWIASWILLAALTLLVGSYLIMITIDINTWREARRKERRVAEGGDAMGGII